MSGRFDVFLPAMISRLALIALLTACSSSSGLSTAKAPSLASMPPRSDPEPPPLWKDPAQPVDERVRDLLSRMTLDEKVAQMMDEAPAIERLGVPAYGWWSEALHGVARAGIATVFPQAIALAATFDETLMRQVATVISDEARAKHHEFVRRGERKRYQGLSFFSPNINLFRDPRWGRGHETFGEDPFLTARMGVAFIQGMQGDHPRYLKTVATAKHYAVHSGPEADRHRFDARVSERDLRDSYLPHFEAAFREGKAESVMGAYNAVGGEPACSNERLLEQILRKEWGFSGFVVSDCGAIRDIWHDHKVVKTREEAAARAVKAGTDLECGTEFKGLVKAVQTGLIAEKEIDRAVGRLFNVRFRLGMFDPPERVPYAQIPYSVNDAPSHRALALKAAQQSMVLLQNRGGALPLRAGLRRIAVIGPTADNLDVLLGNYFGTPSRYVTLLAGIRTAAEPRGAEVIFAQGSELAGDDASRLPEAVAAAQSADQVILVLGLSPRLEGEEGEWKENRSGDRQSIALPAIQEKLMNAVLGARKPTVLVLTGGSALALQSARAKIPGILISWYSGEEGGTAVADILFGTVNPSGRLPVTFYRGAEDLPPFADYSMKGRTYRYFEKEPLYSFGHGLSYTTFEYRALRMASDKLDAGQTLHVAIEVENTGAREGDEVVQLYVRREKAAFPVPIRSLVAVRRITLGPKERRRVEFLLEPRALSVVDQSGRRKVEPGRYTLAVGGGQPGRDHRYPSSRQGLTQTIEVTGTTVELE